MIISQHHIFIIIICILTFIIIMLESYYLESVLQLKQIKLLNIKHIEHEYKLKDENHILKEIIKPPPILGIDEDYEYIFCDPNAYIQSFNIYTEQLDDFIMYSKFTIMTIICVNDINVNIKTYNTKHHMINPNKYEFDSKYSIQINNNTIVKQDFLCKINDQKPIGIIHTLKTNRLIPMCQKIITNDVDISSIYYNVELYGDATQKLCIQDSNKKNKYISKHKITVSKSGYITDIHIVCTDKPTFNGVDIYKGDFIDKILFKANELYYPCENCSNGGKKHTFTCSSDHYLVGINIWKTEQMIEGIQFICFNSSKN